MIRGPESASTLRLLNALRKAKRPIWNDVSEILRKSRRAQKPMTLSRLEKLTKDGDVVVVPGKIVSSGRLSHKITLGYFAASKTALVHLKQSGVNALALKEFLQKHSQDKGIRLLK